MKKIVCKNPFRRLHYPDAFKIIRSADDLYYQKFRHLLKCFAYASSEKSGEYSHTGEENNKQTRLRQKI